MFLGVKNISFFKMLTNVHTKFIANTFNGLECIGRKMIFEVGNTGNMLVVDHYSDV
jgi:hypothetical protein